MVRKIFFKKKYCFFLFVALIELDSKTTPQGKMHSIMECKSYIEEALRTSSDIIINADCFFPALIYVVLKAKPPRLHSNIQFLSQFSQPSGEELYYLANLDSAVRFIEFLQAEHLGLSSNDFSLYMRGEPVLPSKYVSLFNYPLENDLNIQQLRKFSIQYDELEHACEKFQENLSDFNKRLLQSTNDINDLLTNSYTRFSYIDQIPELNNRELNSKAIINIFNQSTTENEHLSDEIVQTKTKDDS
jgi:hypothetical protein